MSAIAESFGDVMGTGADDSSCYAAVLVAEKVGNGAMRKLWFEGMKRMPDPKEHSIRLGELGAAGGH